MRYTGPIMNLKSKSFCVSDFNVSGFADVEVVSFKFLLSILDFTPHHFAHLRDLLS